MAETKLSIFRKGKKMEENNRESIIKLGMGNET